jgi:hypothetical protein
MLCIYLGMFYTTCMSFIQIRITVHFCQIKTSPYAPPDAFCLFERCGIVHHPTAFEVKIYIILDLAFS